ncbi:MAG: TolB family protein [Longimicrobiales bacterium]
MKSLRIGSAVLLLLALGVMTGGCGGDDGTNPDGPSLRILAGAGVTDTIGAFPTQGLVVQVRGADGRPDAGVEVRFDASAQTSLVGVVGVGQNFPVTVAGATTDANGRATVLVRFGSRAGDGFVSVAVPLYNLADTARYTVRPGAAVRVQISPRDTAIEPGRTFRYRGSTVDRANNARPDQATFEATTTAVTVDATGNVAGVRPGVAFVKVRASVGTAVASDSGAIAVVPQARVSFNTGFLGALILSDLTGANRSTLTSAPALAARWAPDGNRLVFNREGALWLVDLNGTVTGLPTPGINNATWPEWSADGQWIYFQGNDNLYRMRPDATGIQELAPGRLANRPSPSPDGSSVAYVVLGPQVMIQNLSTGATRLVPGHGSAVRWSPDGNWLAVVGQGVVNLVRPDLSETRLIQGGGLNPGFSWSPDSKFIVGDNGRIILIDVEARAMVSLPWSGESPAWRPRQ